MNSSEKLVIAKELSIQRFNQRVAMESLSTRHTLVERLNYLKIYESNTKEFFEVRVGKLLSKYLAQMGDFSQHEQYHSLFHQIKEQEKENLEIFSAGFDELKKLLEKLRIYFVDIDDLKQEETENLFEQLSKLTYAPKIVGHGDFLDVSQERFITISETAIDGEYVWCDLPKMKNFVFEKGKSLYVLPYEKALIHYAKELYGIETIKKTTIVRIYHNHHFKIPKAIQKQEEYPEKLSYLLSKRVYQEVTKIDYFGDISPNIQSFLKQKTNMLLPFTFARKFFDYDFITDIVRFIQKNNKSSKNFFTPLENPYKDIAVSQKSDILISFPYENTDLFQKFCQNFLKKDVVSIHATLYRVNENSTLVKYLVKAKEMGKEVKVYIELLARGSENNNIALSKYLISKGIFVCNNKTGFKVHSKLIAVKRIHKETESYQTMVGTGNFNEITMRLYTDFQLITTDKGIYDEAEQFFEFLFEDKKPEFSNLLVTNFNFKEKFLVEIDTEINFAKNGGETAIILKANGLNHPEIIMKLIEASKYMPVTLYIRGVCTITPDVTGYTENIKVYSIVGKFLEHSRIYSFGKGQRKRIIIASADLMKRNIEKRYEVGIFIKSKEIKNHLTSFLSYMKKDTINMHQLQKDKKYVKIKDSPSSCSFKNEYGYIKRKNATKNKLTKQAKHDIL